MQQIFIAPLFTFTTTCFGIYKAIFRWALYSCSLLQLYAEPYVGCFVIPNKIRLGVHKIHNI
jgi:hypothetical protein